MNRNPLIDQLVAVNAQLRRMRRLADNVKSDADFRARLPQLIASCRTVGPLASRVLRTLKSELAKLELELRA